MRIGRYRLGAEIGCGGMAVIFLASADGLPGVRRLVALKCLRPEWADQPEYAAMFLDEATIASQIRHPHVCGVLDAGEADGVRYMAMEYLAGESLSCVRARLADDDPELTPAIRAALVARVIADACEGLHAAHELVDRRGQACNVVHRDVSPDNLFLTCDGCVKVLDFGVSTSAHSRQRTRTGVLKGKLSYLPPEVLRGQRQDRRSDVWGLGVVAWELATGQRLFAAPSDVERLQAISGLKIPAPSKVRRGLPVALDRIIMRALERDPARRPATARELGRQMNRLLANRRVAFGMPELAEVAGRLFPEGRTARQKLVQSLEDVDQESVVLTVDTCEILVEEPAERRRSLRALGHRAARRLRQRRTWLPSAALAAAACLLVVGWSGRQSTGAAAGAPPSAPPVASSRAPAGASAQVVEVPVARGAGEVTLRVSPVDSAGDAILLRVELVPVAGPSEPPEGAVAVRRASLVE
ncbi:MAG TPA: serine/threonine-protein kinase [Kofleriaceae bacterium]|nr:serine/threonine-protein kinase [Kofleriaceae bacterium]